jgi:hypothetical protein
MDGVHRSSGTYVLIKKYDLAWKVVAMSAAQSPGSLSVDPKGRSARDGELLFFSDDLNYVSVEFLPADTTDPKDAREGRFTCFAFGHGRMKNKDFHPNACNSDLTSSVDQLKNTAKQAAGAIVTLGITTLAANSRKAVDPTKVIAAMDSANVLPQVKHYRYTQAFSAAHSSQQLQGFIDRYRNYDPDGLVTEAQSLLPTRLEQEQADSEKRMLATAVAREQEQQERSRRAAELRTRTDHFRQALQPGDDSHCGLVVEVKKPLVKLQTMIGEYWLRIDQLYAAGDHDCRFLNGRYID